MRKHHFHYGMARSIIVILILVGILYVISMYSTTVKLIISQKLNIQPAVLGVKTENKDIGKQMQEEVVGGIDAIKNQKVNIQISDIMSTASKAQKIVEDGKGVASYLKSLLDTLPLKNIPTL